MSILAVAIIAVIAFSLGYITAMLMAMGGRCSAEEEIARLRREQERNR
jgi:hypothetical protein